MVPVTAAYSLMVYGIQSALAVGQDFFSNPAGGSATINASQQGSLGDNIATVINYFLGLLGLISVGFLIYAGILMVTSGGEEEGVTKARKIIMYAVIGIVIIVLAYTIVQFVVNVLG